MRNRAKCKLCESIIESLHPHDYVSCKCGEISVDGGNECYKASAGNWVNFLRVDDENNEITVKVENDNPVFSDSRYKPTKKELLKMLDEMIKNIDELPSGVMISSINHYDFYSLLILLSSIFGELCKEDT